MIERGILKYEEINLSKSYQYHIGGTYGIHVIAGKWNRGLG